LEGCAATGALLSGTRTRPAKHGQPDQRIAWNRANCAKFPLLIRNLEEAIFQSPCSRRSRLAGIGSFDFVGGSVTNIALIVLHIDPVREPDRTRRAIWHAPGG
jgi:hypothetical protein